MRAVAGFDATVSAPKSLRVLWALTGDPVSPRLTMSPPRRSSTIWSGSEQRPGSARTVDGCTLTRQGLTVAAFRQTTSRADDPQLHTHLVISAKVQTDDGRWLALDARVLKRYQRAFGGFYQSVLRAELTTATASRSARSSRGRPRSPVSRATAGAVLEAHRRSRPGPRAKVAEFYAREGRDPTRWERAALTREAAADTRAHKTGNGVPDLKTRWLAEAANVGVTPRT